MDLSMELGNIEVIVGLFALLVIAPILQFWTLKLGLNGMREDVKEGKADGKEIKEDVKRLVAADAARSQDIAVHDQRIVSLESRMKKAEA